MKRHWKSGRFGISLGEILEEMGCQASEGAIVATPKIRSPIREYLTQYGADATNGNIWQNRSLMGTKCASAYIIVESDTALDIVRKPSPLWYSDLVMSTTNFGDIQAVVDKSGAGAAADPDVNNFMSYFGISCTGMARWPSGPSWIPSSRQKVPREKFLGKPESEYKNMYFETPNELEEGATAMMTKQFHSIGCPTWQDVVHSIDSGETDEFDHFTFICTTDDGPDQAYSKTIFFLTFNISALGPW